MFNKRLADGVDDGNGDEDDVDGEENDMVIMVKMMTTEVRRQLGPVRLEVCELL